MSNSQNNPESKSPSDWEDWDDDTAIFDEAEQTAMIAGESMSRYFSYLSNDQFYFS